MVFPLFTHQVLRLLRLLLMRYLKRQFCQEFVLYLLGVYPACAKAYLQLRYQCYSEMLGGLGSQTKQPRTKVGLMANNMGGHHWCLWTGHDALCPRGERTSPVCFTLLKAVMQADCVVNSWTIWNTAETPCTPIVGPRFWIGTLAPLSFLGTGLLPFGVSFEMGYARTTSDTSPRLRHVQNALQRL